MAFSRSAPFSVMSVMSHALPDEQGDSPHTPCFYMCSQTQQRLKADIVMPSKECDCRLFVKTCKKLTEHNFLFSFVISLCRFLSVLRNALSPVKLKTQTQFYFKMAVNVPWPVELLNAS